MKEICENKDSYNFDINMGGLITHKSVNNAYMNQVKVNISDIK